MPFEFSNAGKSSMEAMPVPPFSMSAIHQRAQSRHHRGVRRRFLSATTFVFGAVVIAAAAAGINHGVTLYLWGSRSALTVASLEYIRVPQAQELRSAVAGAPFHFVLPVGVPQDAKIVQLMVAPQDAPTSVTIVYAGSHGYHSGFSIFAPSAVKNATPVNAFATSGFVIWKIGEETVVAAKRLSNAEASQIRSAMRAATPESSLARNEQMTSSIIVLGKWEELQRARQFAAPGDILIDDALVASLPKRISKNDPILDNRIQHIDDIPTKNGEPQYNAAGHISWSHEMAIDVAGMNAIERGLRARGLGTCRCYALVHRSGATYVVRTLPVDGSPVTTFTESAT